MYKNCGRHDEDAEPTDNIEELVIREFAPQVNLDIIGV
jgi:hypothetical protein